LGFNLAVPLIAIHGKQVFSALAGAQHQVARVASDAPEWFGSRPGR